MIALAITAALVIQTYDHQTRVVENLTDAGCDAARCLAQYGQSCIAQAAQGVEEARAEARAKAWRAAHPTPPCYGGICVTADSSVAVRVGRAVPSSATQTAMCVR